ncbi:DNA-binding XRE family transcriptional regulator [Rhizobium tibeticum]|uniref:helix-turn-helix domain-containing protein n=1 Tax=Rhizobium tibeticum TaxID=501024 RepID=UPI002784712A|nr:helix-turn-helix transcriptional regulator [Rhizobium tibeticum]MDP9809878.1 DNA-binding XRE family transcriptional regulator [Rhizobium tibeticum]
MSDVAGFVMIPRRAIAAAEAGLSSINDHNVRLIKFYESKGIEFLGDLTFGQDVGRAGARWKSPKNLDATDIKQFHASQSGLVFRAARALLGIKQADLAKRSDLRGNAIGKVEAGEQWPTVIDRLRRFYEANGVEFLGWTDARTGLLYGVGARWQV